MIELTVTSIPFVLRVLYLRWKGIPVTLYNVHIALFIWLALAFIVFFTVFYYYPKSYTGFVPFRTVPVVSESGGTVTSIEVDNGTRVKPGQVLFTVDNTTEKAAVKTAELRLVEIEKSFASAEAEVHSAEASLDKEEAVLGQANEVFADQDELRRRKSPAYNERRFQSAVADKAAAEARWLKRRPCWTRQASVGRSAARKARQRDGGAGAGQGRIGQDHHPLLCGRRYRPSHLACRRARSPDRDKSCDAHHSGSGPGP